MTNLSNNDAPGLAAYDSDSYTPPDLILGGKSPTMTSYGVTFDDLAQYTLIGRVTETGALVVSNPGASDGSQVPIGVTTHAVTVDNDSNSAVDSNSTLGTNVGEEVGYWLDGVYNYAALTKHANWTLATLRRVLESSGANFTVDEKKTATPTEPAGT